MVCLVEREGLRLHFTCGMVVVGGGWAGRVEPQDGATALPKPRYGKFLFMPWPPPTSPAVCGLPCPCLSQFPVIYANVWQVCMLTASELIFYGS